jgi:hypothetical protein
VEYEAKAKTFMNGPYRDGLTALLTDVYLRILNKGYTARGKAERELVSSPFNCEKSNYKPIV